MSELITGPDSTGGESKKKRQKDIEKIQDSFKHTITND
jgi:hypothetical protein